MNFQLELLKSAEIMEFQGLQRSLDKQNVNKQSCRTWIPVI